MILYPAIDLKDGQAVRLLHGEMDSATVFNEDPAAQAQAFAQAGCCLLYTSPSPRDLSTSRMPSSA